MYIRVKVKPDASLDKIEKVKDNEFVISVREPAERGLANKKVCQILLTHFDNPAGGVKIINGHHSPIKLIKIGND